MVKLDPKRSELVKTISQLVNLLSDEEKQVVLVTGNRLPISIFRTKNLSGLEAITLYLKDVKSLSIKEIAATLNRNPSTIYTTYHKARQKIRGKLNYSDFSFTIPLSVFANRKFSVLESLVSYLKNKNLNLSKIASLLNKNYNTVKTVYRRYQKKC